MKRYLALMIVAAALIAACAKTESESTNAATKRYIEAWMEVHYPGIEPTGSGIYILDETTGAGAAYNGEYYVIMDYNTTDLDGNYSGTTSKIIAQQVGDYEQANYYGPTVMTVVDGGFPAGVYEMLMGMQIGGYKKAVIPGYLNVYDWYDTAEEYLANESDYDSAIYEITLRDFTDDIYLWEVDSLERYMEKNLDGLDSLMYGCYYYQTQAPTDTTSFDSDTSIFINYIGRRLDGQVFDTTIEDTAKFYGIYDSDNDYEPVEIEWGDEYTDLVMVVDDEDTDIITGFQWIIWQMRAYEKGTGIFMSYYGYASSGSGDTIPAYCPLRFDIELVDDPDD